MSTGRPVTSERAVAQRFRELRIAAGFSQADTAARMVELGWPWHQSTIFRIENGTQALRVGELIDLAKVFGVPAGRLLGDEGHDLAEEHREMERVIRERIAAEIAAGLSGAA